MRGATPAIYNTVTFTYDFNPRSPCGERLIMTKRSEDKIYFNPRSPCGERLLSLTGPAPFRNFNPRSPCGERPPGQRPYAPAGCHFNPRSPCGERRLDRMAGVSDNIFQSTLPVRGATNFASIHTGMLFISIHAPRAGSDILPRLKPPVRVGFQSTLPVRGATNATTLLMVYQLKFQSTLPVRGATR